MPSPGGYFCCWWLVLGVVVMVLELSWVLLPHSQVSDGFMCLMLDCGAVWAACALCHVLAAIESSLCPHLGTPLVKHEVLGAAAPSPPRPRFYCPASLLLCLQGRRFIGFPMNSFKEKVITLSQAG